MNGVSLTLQLHYKEVGRRKYVEVLENSEVRVVKGSRLNEISKYINHIHSTSKSFFSDHQIQYRYTRRRN